MSAPDPVPNTAAHRGWRTYLVLSILLLAPVFWQPRVQAGDLSSHIYNAWLAELIETGRTQGMVVVQQTTNVLFDLMLSALFRVGGAEFAQRVSVSVAVLIFVWGAFRFIGVVSGRPPWHLIPCVAMLAYGWVFHMGFFNFYLSMGLSLWALAVAWNWTRLGIAIALPLLALAYLAHALPVVWAVGLGVYQLVASRMSPRARAYVTAGWLLIMVVMNLAVGKATFTKWSPAQIRMATGADQVWVFDGKYYLVLMGLLMVWALLFMDLVKNREVRDVVSGIPFQFCAISAAAVFILPTTVQVPGFHHSLVYISERMSLGVGVCVCALLAAGVPRRFERYALIAVAVLFFGFLYRDERMLNAIEDRMESAVAHLEPGTRVLNGLVDPNLRTFVLTHMIDRVCIGRCFSYANYEASTLQFRVRAFSGNPIVVTDYGDSWKMQNGVYVVKDTDPPLLQVYLDENGGISTRPLKAGTPCGTKYLKVLPDLFSTV